MVFVDESGFYLLPGVVKTYGRKGQTPVVEEWQTRDHLSVMGGLTTTVTGGAVLGQPLLVTVRVTGKEPVLR